MGVFNKGNCCVCERSCNLFNYKKLNNGVVCTNCAEDLKKQGLINSENDLEKLTKEKIIDRVKKSKMVIEKLTPITTADIVLKKDEICYYVGDAQSYHEKNVVTGYVREGGSRGIRIAKGITIGRSTGTSTAVRENVVEKYPAKFYITNKRIILTAPKYGFELNVDKVTSLKNYSNAFDFYCNGKTYTVITNEVKYIIQICSLIAAIQGE